MPVTILRDLVVTRVDLVDFGENQAADVVLFKRRTTTATKENEMEKTGGLDLSKMAENERKTVEALQKRAADADTAEELARKTEERAVAAEKERDALKAQLEAKRTPEDIEKARVAALPEDIRKRLEDNEAEVRKLREERDTTEYIAKARALPLSGTSPENFGPLLRRIATGTTTQADAEEVTRMVKSLGEQIKAADVFGEKGRSGGADAGSTYEEARGLAKAKVEAGQFATVEKALQAVWKEKPELWKRYREEGR
jgi:hypothetical protein